MVWVSSVALFSFLMSITPGPNNMMLAASGLSFGWRRTVPQLLGILVGVIALVAAIAAGVGELFVLAPWLHIALKLGGSAYLLWLAWRLWTSAGLHDSALASPMGFWRAFAFQFLNPKAWVMALGLVAGFMTPGAGYLSSAALTLLVFSTVQAPSISVWAAFGAGLRRWLSEPRTYVIVGRTLAALTAATVALLWL